MEITKDLLINLYYKKNCSATHIADKLNCSSSFIYNKLKLWKIKTRDARNCQIPKRFNKDQIFVLYVKQKKSTREIANQLGCSEETIRRFLIRSNIERRDKTYNFGGHNKGTPLSNEIKRALSKQRKNYHQKNPHWNKGNKTSIKTREKISQTLLGGRTPAPSRYGYNWQIQRTSCLQRDKYTCQQCSAIRNLEVHHWTPYRFSYDNSSDNLVVLCSDCHREKHLEYKKEGFIKEMEREFYENI